MASRDIKITIIGDASKAQKAFNDAGTSAGTFETKVEGLGSKFGTFAGTLGGVVTGGALASLPGILMDGAKGATEDAAAMDKLKQAVSNTGKSYDTYSGSIDDAIKRGQDLAFTDGETADALSTLIGLTGDTDEGMRRLSLAQDLARGTGMDLQTAAKLLGKTSEENTAALSRYGIQLGKNATAQDVLNAVDAKFGGQAGTFAESDAGKLLKSQQAAGELAETFGSFLIPAMLLASQVATQIGNVLTTYVAPAFQAVIDALAPVVSTFASFVADHSGPIIAALVGIGTAILVTVIPSLVAWVAGMVPVIASHVALAAAVVVAYAPIIAIMVVVGAAAAALYIAWQENLFGIQDITKQVIDFIWPYIQSGMDSMVSTITTALGIVQGIWNTVFPAIQSVVETVFPIIAQIASTYITILKTEIELGVAAARWAFDNVFVPIQGIVSDVFTTIAGLVTTLWGPTVTAIGVGVDGIKVAFDGLVYIQGVVSDIFSTISGLVASLWLGASGGVGMILAGVATIYGVFEGAYDRMYSAGAAIVQGLIDGIVSLYNTLKGWVDKIADLLIIDVPGFSPPYSAGFKQGKSYMGGWADGLNAGLPAVATATGTIGRYLGDDSHWSRPGSGGAAPFTSPSGHFANPQSGGGGISSFGAFGERDQPFMAPNIAFSGGSQYGSAQGARGMLTEDFESRIERAVERGIKRGLGGAI